MEEFKYHIKKFFNFVFLIRHWIILLAPLLALSLIVCALAIEIRELHIKMSEALLILTGVNTLSILGLYIAANHKDSSNRGLILQQTRDFYKGLLGPYWSKPFYGCHKCMPSLHGGIPLLVGMVLYILLPDTKHDLYTLFIAIGSVMIYVPMLTAVTTIVYSIYELNAVKIKVTDPFSCDATAERIQQATDARKTPQEDVPTSFKVMVQNDGEKMTLQQFMKEAIDVELPTEDQQ